MLVIGGVYRPGRERVGRRSPSSKGEAVVVLGGVVGGILLLMQSGYVMCLEGMARGYRRLVVGELVHLGSRLCDCASGCEP